MTLEMLQEEQFAAYMALRRAQERVTAADKAVRECVAELLNLDSVHVGRNACTIASPTGTCIYDANLDPWWDTCLYCREPAERK
jgi:hypothetical protein